MVIPVTESSPIPDPSLHKREQLTRRILDAATALFAEAGYHGTSIPDVMARAGVGGGSLYRLFASKEALINAVFRDAKGRLERALRDGLPLDQPPRVLFDSFWARLTAFSRAEPVAFRFLELQDHVPYLDGESRQLELAVLAPILVACMDFQRRGVFRPEVPADTIMAFVWGAFVGLVKAERLGYVKLGPAAFEAARDACWRAFAVAADEPSRDPSPPAAPTGEVLPQSERKTRWKRAK
jgi:AcrR family transcriptional regulator